MPTQAGSDVIRFVEQGRDCHVIQDYMQGQTLIQWMKEHPVVLKSQFLGWMAELIRQLDKLHHSKGNPCYRYLTPFSIFISNSGSLMLLNLAAEGNTAIVKQLQRRSIRSGFLLEGKEMKPLESIAADIYSFGKTMQFFLSRSELSPKLSKKEEYLLRTIIQKCMGEHPKYSYLQIKEILKQLPTIKQKKIRPTQKSIRYAVGKIVKVILMIAVILAIGAGIFLFIESKTAVQRGSTAAASLPVEYVNHEADTPELYRELGLLYFLELTDYQKSRQYFSDAPAEDRISDCLQQMSVYLLGGGENTEEQMAAVLEEAEEAIPDKQDTRYYRCLMRVYAVISTTAAKEALVRLGEYCAAQPQWQEGEAGHNAEIELQENLAVGYEGTGEKEKAAEQYRMLLAPGSESEKQEAQYQRLTELYAETGRTEDAMACCLEGIETVKDSVSLRLLYIDMQCKETEADPLVCAQTIKTFLQDCPQIKEDTEFQKLQQKYQITLEGETVWVGKR